VIGAAQARNRGGFPGAGVFSRRPVVASGAMRLSSQSTALSAENRRGSPAGASSRQIIAAA
jgi:hypothetical protein